MDLLEPGQQAQVSALARPANGVNEYGDVVKPFPFMGATPVPDPVHFHLTERAAVMHRPDGKKIDFVHNHFVAKLKQDILYLVNEIENGHPYLRFATSQEIDAHDMAADPRGTVAKQLRPQIEEETRDKLMAEIREKLQNGMSSEDLLASIDRPRREEGVTSGTATVVLGADADSATSQQLANQQKVKQPSAADMLAAMRASAGISRPTITPGNTNDIKDAADGGIA